MDYITSFEMEYGFTSTIAEVIFNGDMSVAKFLKAPDYISRDGQHYRLPYCQPTDFASTPKSTWGFPLFLIPTGWWSIPAGFHDSAFQNLLLVVNPDGSTSLADLPESKCNDLLLEMMQAVKPNPTLLEKSQMNSIYAGVTLGGWHAYRQDRS